MTYKFRDVETGKIRKFDFETMMAADVAGFVWVDGREYRRVRDPSSRAQGSGNPSAPKPIVSDAMGFPQQALKDFEADRQAHGFTGVEFKRDPTEPTFYQVHCDSPQTWKRYVKHRGYTDMNSRNGSAAILSLDQIDKAIELAKRVTAGAFKKDA